MKHPLQLTLRGGRGSRGEVVPEPLVRRQELGASDSNASAKRGVPSTRSAPGSRSRRSEVLGQQPIAAQIVSFDEPIEDPPAERRLVVPRAHRPLPLREAPSGSGASVARSLRTA